MPVNAHSEIIEVESEVNIKYFENFKENKYGFLVFLFQIKAISLNSLVNKSILELSVRREGIIQKE